MKTYEVSRVMYIELMSCKPTVTTILNSNSLFGNFVTGSVLASAIELMFFCCCITDKGEQIHSSVFGKFPIHLYYVYTAAHALFSNFTCLLRNRNTSFFASVDASTLAQ